MNRLISYQTHTRPYASLLLVAGLLCALLLPQSALAFFSNTEQSGGERFQATELQLLPVSNHDTVMVNENNAGEFTNSFLLSSNSTAAQYDVVVDSVSTDGLCSALELQSTSTEAVIASQPLANFASAATTMTGIWSFAATMDTVPLGVTSGSECTATFTVTAWQDNMTKAAPGYFDTTTFTVQFVYQAAIVANRAMAFTSAITDTTTNGDGEDDAVDEKKSDDKDEKIKSATEVDEAEPENDEKEVTTPPASDDESESTNTDKENNENTPVEDDATTDDEADDAANEKPAKEPAGDPDTLEGTTPPNSVKDEEGGGEDTESAPLPDPEPVEKRVEEETPAGDDGGEEINTSEPKEDNNSEKDKEPNADETEEPKKEETKPEPTDEGTASENEPVIDESGTTPNDDNA